jgi:hypothetical protein
MTSPDVVSPFRRDGGADGGPGGFGASSEPSRRGGAAHARRRRGPLPASRAHSVLAPLAPYAAAGSLYLALAVLVWWHAWSSHPTTTTLCACGDPALFLWFLEWPAHALAHGANPLSTSLLFHPQGINMLSNTSVLAIGLPLAPVTWLFGPVAALNVASTLAPALSALAMFGLLRRWVSWAPAAFVGGLLYGFAPFELDSLAYGHLMTSVLVIPPLVVACLDELIIRRRHRAPVVGAVLGLLLVVEFFISTEILVITVLLSAVGIGLMAAFAAVRRRPGLRSAAGAAGPGLGVAALVAGVALAYPAWYALAGPAHLSSPVWIGLAKRGGTTASSFVHAFGPASASKIQAFGGYLGPPLPSSAYLGVGLLVVLIGGLVCFRRDLRLWLFAAVAGVSVLLSFNVNPHEAWIPWRYVSRLPLLGNIVEQRFTLAVYLSAAVMLALILDHTRRGVIDGARRHALAGATAAAATLVATTAVAAVALVPVARAEASSVPLTMAAVRVPAWFSSAGDHLAPGTPVLVYPFPASGIQTAMTWQAVPGLTFAQVGGGGPESEARRVPTDHRGYVVLQTLSFSFAPSPRPTAANLEAVRAYLVSTGVQVVVIPGAVPNPGTDAGRSATYAVGFMTAALGRAPTIENGAWVWRDVGRRLVGSPPLAIGPDAVDRCIDGLPPTPPARGRIPACVVAAAGRRA